MASSAGRAEELMRVLVGLEARFVARERVRLPRKPAWARSLFETPLNLAGYAVGAAVARMPPPAALVIQTGCCRMLAGRAAFASDRSFAAGLEHARSVHDAITGRSRRPAVWCLLSHPPVGVGALALNFELARRALEIVPAVRGRAERIHFVLAIDRFALDATPLWQEGLYAGAIAALHLALDRQPSERGPWQRRLFARARPERVARGLFGRLRRGENVAMVLPGGVEPNARILYAGREFLRRLRGTCRMRRRLEHEALARLTEGDPAAAETGSLDPDSETALLRFGEALGIGGEALREALAEFREEFARRTPYRRRLFALVLRRVVARGRPIVLLALSHRGEAIRLGAPLALVPGDPGGEEALGRIKDWVRENFD